MINIINKFREISRTEGRSRSKRAEGTSDLPLDKKLTYVTYHNERWTFENGNKLYLDGEDVNQLIDDDRDNIRLLCGLSQGLHEYQTFVWSKGGKGQADFNAMVNAVQDKVHIRLSDIYEDITGGVRFEYSDGDLWINDIHVRKLIKLFYLRPTEKARQYLSSIRDKLSLILSRQHSSKRYDGVHKEASALFSDISLAMEYIPTDAPPRLVGRVRYV